MLMHCLHCKRPREQHFADGGCPHGKPFDGQYREPPTFFEAPATHTGEVVRKLLESNSISDVARMGGVSRQTVYVWLNGGKASPETTQRLLTALNLKSTRETL